ncbi:MAG: leucyl/phenylalanyl-tRNA--protein transferase [Alphaproteobacteria bacterium]
MQLILTPELLIEAYKQGLFPMAYSAHSPYIQWLRPQMRGQLSIEEIHIPRRLLKTLKKNPYEIRIDSAFDDVMRACAAPAEKRPETWINTPIFEAFSALHKLGYAHSVECWKDGEPAGGIYGLAVGAAFFAESMFFHRRDASKVALIHLVARLWKGGFSVLDTQFSNPHLKQFGVYEIPYAHYQTHLNASAPVPGDFNLRGTREDDILRDYLEFKKNRV